VRLHALPDPVQELHHADLGCARAGVELCSANELGDQRGDRRTLVGLCVEGSRRSSGAGVEEEAAHMGEGSHGGKERGRGKRVFGGNFIFYPCLDLFPYFTLPSLFREGDFVHTSFSAPTSCCSLIRSF
jgi:hypothetical protein